MSSEKLTEEARKQFEVWADGRLSLDCDDKGYYVKVWTRTAWEAWQAALAEWVCEWISVEDRLPTYEEYVSVLVTGPDVERSTEYPTDMFLTMIEEGVRFTHWMPTPEPPQDTED